MVEPTRASILRSQQMDRKIFCVSSLPFSINVLCNEETHVQKHSGLLRLFIHIFLNI